MIHLIPSPYPAMCVCVLKKLVWVGGGRGAWGMGDGKAAKMIRGSIFWQDCNFFCRMIYKKQQKLYQLPERPT